MKISRWAVYLGTVGLIGGSLWFMNRKNSETLDLDLYDDSVEQDMVPIRGGRIKLLRRFRW